MSNVEAPDRANRAGDQPLPVPNERPSVQSLVRADLDTREQIGVRRYGTPLQPFNGRDGLRDLYEELLDATCYVRQVIEEGSRGLPGVENPGVVDGDLLVDLLANMVPREWSDQAAREYAERTLAQMATAGFRILRGPGSQPWQPAADNAGAS